MRKGILITALIMVCAIWTISLEPQKITDDRVKEIYSELIAQTGSIQDALPIVISEDPEVNAFNDGRKVVINRGLINFVKNEDELAMIMGHEIAHGMLRHVYYPEFQSSEKELSVAEANADKMGAIYMMKDGYNICIARKFWKRLELAEGNYIGGNHPNNSYRYEELNIGCE